MTNIEALKVLIVEDDLEISSLIKKYLIKENFEVDIETSEKGAIELFKSKKYHLLLLDLMLKDSDGFLICHKIRKISNIPIIIITAKTEEKNKILGLEIGADDYITKPFSIHELTARVKAHIRRFIELNQKTDQIQTNTILLKNIVIDRDKHKVLIKEKEIKLTTIEFDLLVFLASNKERVFTKFQIYKNVWKEDFTFDNNTVTVHIRRLRKKIEENPDSPVFICTEWGIGYKFCDE